MIKNNKTKTFVLLAINLIMVSISYSSQKDILPTFLSSKELLLFIDSIKIKDSLISFNIPYRVKEDYFLFPVDINDSIYLTPFHPDLYGLFCEAPSETTYYLGNENLIEEEVIKTKSSNFVNSPKKYEPFFCDEKIDIDFIKVDTNKCFLLLNVKDVFFYIPTRTDTVIQLIQCSLIQKDSLDTNSKRRGFTSIGYGRGYGGGFG